MRQFRDKNGKPINIQQFSNLEEKLATARQYVRMFNDMTGLGMPHYNEEQVLDGIRKEHDKFYGMCSKYDGQGRLRI